VNIGQAAKATGVSAKMIRYYEDVGLMPKASRTTSGYRHYQPSDLHVLRFVRQARAVGFSVIDIRQLLALWQDRRRPAREVKRLAQRHLSDVESRIRELEAIADTLKHLIEHCHGDARPDCPILDALADVPAAQAEPLGGGRANPRRKAVLRPPR